MLASDISPFALSFLAMCGGSSGSAIDDTPTETGISCWEYQSMIDVELEFGQVCTLDAECDQVIPVSDSCTTADPVLNISFDSEWLLDTIDEAEGVGCTVDYGPRGDCDPDAEPTCLFGSCTWE